jgi:hypothetical protein
MLSGPRTAIPTPSTVDLPPHRVKGGDTAVIPDGDTAEPACGTTGCPSIVSPRGNKTMNTTFTTRIGAVVLMAAAAAVVPMGAQGAPACEPSACSATVVTQSSPYAEPLAALGGRTLAEYLADHTAQVLAAPGV